MSRELRGVIIYDYITPLRPFGEKICLWQIFSLRPSTIMNYTKRLLFFFDDGEVGFVELELVDG